MESETLQTFSRVIEGVQSSCNGSMLDYISAFEPALRVETAF